MKCTSTRRWILLALTDSLSARRNRKLNEHLEKCPACRTESRQARDLWEEIAHDETRDPGPTYWQSFASRVRRRIDAHDEAGAPVESLAVAARAGELWCRALAAAAVVLVVALALLDRPQEPPIFETDEILADVLQASELTDEILPAAFSVEDPLADLYEEFNHLSPKQVQRLWTWLEQEIDTSGLPHRRNDDEVS
ncbi:MAG: zf-HC2 domain-containing protein [Acidobacteriota bacterium]|nr:hypothetical protein [Acidobacteriota bacterium]